MARTDIFIISPNDTYGNTSVSRSIPVTGTTALVVEPTVQNRLLRTTFSSVPLASQTEIDQEYEELGTALEEMTHLEEGDDWKVDSAVFRTACGVAAELRGNFFPAPRVFNHGSKSVVFNWSQGHNNLYLTVSSDRISALISSPARIKRRLELSTRDLPQPHVILGGLLSANLERPLVSTSTAASSIPEFRGILR